MTSYPRQPLERERWLRERPDREVHHEHYLLTERLDALRALVPLLREKRSALMCVEHDPTTCHRTVIMDVLRDEHAVALDVAQIA